MIIEHLWILFTLLAAASQTARNAAQRGLTEVVGTAGATHVRFLFGLPFAILFLLLTFSFAGIPALHLRGEFLLWLLLGALTQIVATALMLGAMRRRSFVVTIATIKTEPVQVAFFAALFLGEYPSSLTMAAILAATIGVIAMSLPASLRPGRSAPGASIDPSGPAPGAWGAIWLGVAAGGMFALSAVGFRGAILALGDSAFYVRATVTLVCGLALQSAVLSAWLALREPGVLTAIASAWRPSVFAGFMGACASQMWFLAFALASVAQVRTLALVEVLMAQLIARRLFSQDTTRIEWLGIVLVVLGAAGVLMG